MDKNDTCNSLCRLLDSDKPTFEFLIDVIELLQKKFNNALWNIGAVSESTSQLNFVKTAPPFDKFNNLAKESFINGNSLIKKKDIESHRLLCTIPITYKERKLGVVIYAGKKVKIKEIEKVGDELGFILQQYTLKRKLIKDTILMNTIIMSSQSTASSTEVDPLIKILLPQLHKYLSADGIRLYIWDKEDSFFYDQNGKKQNFKLPDKRSIVETVKAGGRPLMFNNAYKHLKFNPDIDCINSEDKTLNLIAAPVKVADKVSGVLLAVNNEQNKVFVGSDLVWVRSVCGEIGVFMERLKLYQDIRKLFLNSIEAMATAIEGKDPYTHGHSRRVTMYSVVIGKELGLDENIIENIRISALLHDIGKIAISESILLKTARLTEDEWEELRQHPQKGVNILKPVEEFEPLFPGIKHHHERFDGKGYPDGLKDKEIPLIARIINVVDAFDAMNSDRIYRAALSEDEALNEIKDGMGGQFDPEIADLFIKIYKEKFYSGRNP